MSAEALAGTDSAILAEGDGSSTDPAWPFSFLLGLKSHSCRQGAAPDPLPGGAMEKVHGDCRELGKHQFC